MAHGLRFSEEWLAERNARLMPRAQPVPVAPVPSKFGNVKTDGCDSRKEAKHIANLRLMEQAGEISGLVTQPQFLLIPKVVEKGKVVERAVTYTADAQYMDRDGRLRVIDVKGFRTEAYVLRRKLMRFVHNIVVEEV